MNGIISTNGFTSRRNKKVLIQEWTKRILGLSSTRINIKNEGQRPCNDSEVKNMSNPFIDFDTGQIKGIPIDKMGKDAITMTLDYYNRNLFKPAVLLRYAFFTRVFLEESMRPEAWTGFAIIALGFAVTDGRLFKRRSKR